MRVLIAPVVALSIGLGWGPTSHADDEEDAIKALQEIGGSIRQIAADSTDKEAAFHLAGKEITDDQLAHLQKVSGLVWLNLRDTKVTDAGMPHLGACKSLTRLHLERTAVGDAGLEALAGLENLEYLNLYGTQVSDAGLEHLKGLKNLKRLYLWQSKVTPEGAAKLNEALPELMVVLGLDVQPAAANGDDEAKADDATSGDEAKSDDDGN